MTWYSQDIQKKYHSDLGIPDYAKTNFGHMLLDYSQHALQAAQSDRYDNKINLPRALDTSKAQVIEVETDGKKTTKVLYRIPYSDEFDLMIAIMPDRRFVKTVWLNRTDDQHETLQDWKYDIPDAPQQELEQAV
jgi:hypothetical protein